MIGVVDERWVATAVKALKDKRAVFYVHKRIQQKQESYITKATGTYITI
jgi:hypothetical protein